MLCQLLVPILLVSLIGILQIVVDDALKTVNENEQVQFYQEQLLSSMYVPMYFRKLHGFPFFYSVADPDLVESIGECTYDGNRTNMLGNTFNFYDNDLADLPFYVKKATLEELDETALNSKISSH